MYKILLLHRTKYMNKNIKNKNKTIKIGKYPR